MLSLLKLLISYWHTFSLYCCLLCFQQFYEFATMKTLPRSPRNQLFMMKKVEHNRNVIVAICALSEAFVFVTMRRRKTALTALSEFTTKCDCWIFEKLYSKVDKSNNEPENHSLADGQISSETSNHAASQPIIRRTGQIVDWRVRLSVRFVISPLC